MKKRLFGSFMPMMEADGAGGGGTPPAGQSGAPTVGGTPPVAGAVSGNQTSADFAQVLGIVESRAKAAEESALKGFFKDQGLSQDEVQQAIAAFKTEKAKSQPNPDALKKEAETAKETALKAITESRAVLLAVELGIEAKSIPYVLKLADMSKALKEGGTTDDEAIKAALNKVLEDVPAFKGGAPAPAKPGYTPKGGGAPATESRAAAIAAERKKSTDNPYANAWAQK